MGGTDETAYEVAAIAPEGDAQNDLAICLVSGGLDSCVTAAIAHRDVVEIAFLHVSYGQRTQERELRAFEEIANHFDVKQRLVVSIEHLAIIGGSSLTDRNIPLSGANLQEHSIPTSYVPFRNSHLLAIATSWAEVIGAASIYIGAVAEDSSGYPDCRPEFYKAFQQVINLGTRPDTNIEIRTPVIEMNKAQIVELGQSMEAPLKLTWSCYGELEQACGECDSCALRLRAFRAAGIRDPIPYVLDSKRFAY
jgi:7-cyano-7-deazaguanine synthase